VPKVQLHSFFGSSLSVLFLCAVAVAQTVPTSDPPLEFGLSPFNIPPGIEINTTPPRVVEMLVEALQAEPVVQRRVELVRDLGRCRLPAALSPVIAAMGDREAAVRAEAARSAAVLGNRAALSSLQELLKDSSPAVRAETILAGAALDDPAFVTAGLKDADESCFTTACAVVSAPEHEAQIIARWTSLSPSAQVVAIRALARRGAVAHADLIVAQLDSQDLPLLIAAIQALERIKARPQREAVARLLEHHHPTVRRSAVAAMSSLAGDKEQIEVATKMLGDADLSVRQAAAQLLVAHPSSDVTIIALLEEQLSAGYQPLRKAARDALVSASAHSEGLVVNAAVKLLHHGDADRREDGSYVLGSIGSDAALDRHIELLKDQDWDVVRQAAESLGEIGSAEAAPELAKLAAQATLADYAPATDPSTQAQAIVSAFIACGKLRYKPVLSVARPLIPDKMNYSAAIRAPAVWAAGMAGDADDAALAAQLLSAYRDTSPYESEEVRLEAVKAIGNLRHLPVLEQVREEGKRNPSPRLRWMAHHVADGMAGTTTPYVPPTVAVVADTRIQALGD
jgi:HEAT repeat protein